MALRVRMDRHIHTPLLLKTVVTICFFFFFLTTLPQSLCKQQQQQTNYSVCSQPYNCGVVSNIYYPFWGQNRPNYCGGGPQFKLDCDDKYQLTSIQVDKHNFSVLNINTSPSAYTIRMAKTDLVDDVCAPELTNISLSPGVFSHPETVHNITIFYNCPSEGSIGGNNYTCPNNWNRIAFYVDVEDDLFWKFPGLLECEHRIQVPASQGVSLEPGDGIDGLRQALPDDFEVNYIIPHGPECSTCQESGGACGTSDPDNYQFSCYCPHGSDASLHCSAPAPGPNHSNRGLNVGIKVSIAVASAVFGALVVVIAFYIHQRRKKNGYAMSYVQSQNLSSDPSLKDTEKGSRYFGVHLFTYDELEEATNYFDSARELGDGGFGTVYFGKLRDGRCVAVKRLYENNYRRVEQFMNEVEILTRLRHQNLVSLYGCTSRHSRELLLVYEFVPNGTVADHLHGEKAKTCTLPWDIRMNIAVETASALRYLHASDIIHRDVKTNNILLDNHFCVKVADFGLSRLFPNDVTHISTAPQGTPGYVDPEYHECYQLTDKSDVYSFGVVLIELISSLPAVDITRHRHEINLANMAINKIHNQALHELVDPALGFESDFKVRKMINAVAELAFQCLQSSKDVRPTMEEVTDRLKDIQSDRKNKSQPEVMDISGDDDVVLLKEEPPPPSPDSNLGSKSTTPNTSG